MKFKKLNMILNESKVTLDEIPEVIETLENVAADFEKLQPYTYSLDYKQESRNIIKWIEENVKSTDVRTTTDGRDQIAMIEIPTSEGMQSFWFVVSDDLLHDGYIAAEMGDIGFKHKLNRNGKITNVDLIESIRTLVEYLETKK